MSQITLYIFFLKKTNGKTPIYRSKQKGQVSRKIMKLVDERSTLKVGRLTPYALRAGQWNDKVSTIPCSKDGIPCQVQRSTSGQTVQHKITHVTHGNF
jgi:hypothetical protein